MGIIGFTDIHCHILPGVDDGAQTMEQAQEMIRIAIRRIPGELSRHPTMGQAERRNPAVSLLRVTEN